MSRPPTLQEDPRPLAIAALLGSALLVLFWETAASMVAIWSRSETFMHGFLIFPLSAWMLWQRRADIRMLPVRPALRFLPLLLLCFALWLLADVAEVGVVRQYALILMLVTACALVFGPTLTAACAFPLAFLLLAVPFGEVFVPRLITITARFAVGLLELTGIPVLQEGNSFSIPSGDWSVVEACSGVRYLIASVTLGCLYAYLSYQRLYKRLLFIVLSVLVPILANGVRAYLIVMIGHLSGMTLAVGVDHLIYGWLFFGLVMFLMFWIGNFWRDPPVATPLTAPIDDASARLPGVRLPLSAWTLPVCAALLLGVLVVLSGMTIRAQQARAPGLPPPPSGWQAATTTPPWSSAFAPTLVRGDWVATAHATTLEVREYSGQPAQPPLVSSGNRLVEDHDPLWRLIETRVLSAGTQTAPFAVQESRVRSAQHARLIWQWFVIDQRTYADPGLAKLAQAWQRLRLRGTSGQVWFLSAPYGDDPDTARRQLAEAARAWGAPPATVDRP